MISPGRTPSLTPMLCSYCPIFLIVFLSKLFKRTIYIVSMSSLSSLSSTYSGPASNCVSWLNSILSRLLVSSKVIKPSGHSLSLSCLNSISWGYVDYFVLLKTLLFLAFHDFFSLTLFRLHWLCFSDFVGWLFLFHPIWKCWYSSELGLGSASLFLQSLFLADLFKFYIFKWNFYTEASSIYIFYFNLSWVLDL